MIKNGWYYHKCGQKNFKVTPDTVLINFVAYCKKCKTEYVISIANEKVIANKEKETKNEEETF